ncbi:MAG: TonB family protein [Sphingomonas sp.]|jgi:TonB family protein|uniref:TonB family protein n=1 Tax=Sphingomonas sp. TaxID=28214 RepID=UPI003563FCC3
MRIRGQYGLIVALAIMPTSALAKDKSAPARLVGNAGSFFGADAYPPEAIRAAEEGRVVATVAVDAAGAPTGCATATSSGSASLDAKTCAIAMANLHFTPALDSGGRPTSGSYTLAVRWVLPAADTTAVLRTVAFSGTPTAPICSTVAGGVTRQLVPGTCRALADAVVAQGANLAEITIRVSVGADDLVPLVK